MRLNQTKVDRSFVVLHGVGTDGETLGDGKCFLLVSEQ